MSLDHLYRSLGDLQFPIDPVEVAAGQPFPVGDPGVDKLAAFFRAVINQELGGGVATVDATSWWAKARTGTTLSAALPVADTLYQAPTPALMKEAAFAFPLLAVYRVSAVDDYHTLWQARTTWTWGVDYILGPLTAEAQRRLLAALTRVHHVLRLAIEAGYHPAYESGAGQFGEDGGRFETIGINTSQIGAAQFGEQQDGVIFHMLHMELQTAEHDGDIAEEAPFDGASGSIGIASPQGTLPDVVQVRTENVPDPAHPKVGPTDPTT